jgi:hypothetical protein
MKVLDVYLIFDLSCSFDIDVITKCVKVYLITKLNYEVDKCENITEVLTKKGEFRKFDVIKRGLEYFSEANRMLKLKSSNECWFIYISNGKIHGFSSNISLILLSKHPGMNECFYSINKRLFNILKDSEKEIKLDELKLFTKSLTEVVNTTKSIKYSAL